MPPSLPATEVELAKRLADKEASLERQHKHQEDLDSKEALRIEQRLEQLRMRDLGEEIGKGAGA